MMSIRKAISFCFICLMVAMFLTANIANALDGSLIPLTITERSGKDLTNYPVLVKFNKTNFPFDDKDQGFSFKDENNEKYDYWTEKIDYDANEANIWVKIPFLKAGQSETIYLDLGDSDISDGENTFDLFDDFNDNTLNNAKWGIDSNRPGNTYSERDGIWESDTMRGGGWGAAVKLYSRKTFSQPVVLEGRFNQVSGETRHHTRLGFTDYLVPNSQFYGIDFGHEDLPDDTIGKMLISDNGFTNTGDYYQGKWYDIKIILNDNSISVDTGNGLSSRSQKKATALNIMVETAGGNNGWTRSWFDDIRVRRYASPEPEVFLGDDMVFSPDSLFIRKNKDIYTIKGTVFSSFKKDLKNVEVSIYESDPLKSQALEITRFTIETAGSNKETDFESEVKLNNDPKGLYLYIDSDGILKEENRENNLTYTDNIKEENNLESFAPFFKNIIFFIALFLILFLVYRFSATIKEARKQIPQIAQAKTCIQCGMSVDQSQPKCPVCGSTMFK